MAIKKVASTVFFTVSLNTFAATNVLIDGKKFRANEDLPSVFRKQMNMPAVQNKNLDSVYDVLLSDFKTESIVRIKNVAILRRKLGDQYVNDFIDVVNQAAEDNSRVVLILE